MTHSAQVLLVDDDPLVRFALTEVLAESGIKTLQAGSTTEALSTLSKEQDIRVVVTDVDMPGSINGLGLVRLLADGMPYLRVIVISGLPLPKDVKLSDDVIFMQKPFSFERLAEAVDGLLPH